MGGRALWLLPLMGCTALWRIDHVDLPVDATATDGPRPGDGLVDAPMCQPSMGFHPDLTSTIPCSPWATPFGSTAKDVITQGGGSLTISKGAMDSTGCETPSPVVFDPSGIFVSIDQVLANGVTAIVLPVDAGSAGLSGTRWSISITAGFLALNYSGVSQSGIIYSPATMRFVRLRPVSDGVAAEYSSDAANWMMLGHDPNPPPTALYVALTGYEAMAPTTPDVTTFSHLNVCP